MFCFSTSERAYPYTSKEFFMSIRTLNFMVLFKIQSYITSYCIHTVMILLILVFVLCIWLSDALVFLCTFFWEQFFVFSRCEVQVWSFVIDLLLISFSSFTMHLFFLVLQVVIGQEFVVPAYSKVSLLQQPTKQDSDEELEYADHSSGIVEIPGNSSCSYAVK